MGIIIGLLGGAGAGKSLAAKYLEQKYGAKRYSLAGPLKEFIGKTFDLTEDQLHGSQLSKETVDPRYNVTPRWLLQRAGTQGFRGVFGEDFWIDYLLKKVKEDGPALAVCDDCRFINEAYGIHDKRGYLIRLENSRVVSSADTTHQSEAEWSKCPYDFIIKHDGVTAQYLYNQLDYACSKMGITPTSLLTK